MRDQIEHENFHRIATGNTYVGIPTGE